MDGSGLDGRRRSRWRLWVLIVSSGVLVPTAIALTDSKAVLVGALFGLCLYQVRRYYSSSPEVFPGREPED
ncbi:MULTISPECIES: hypothetical protein [Trichocoleus]|uniref:Uncharacterized protein n=1 Tax=Trichocoleus desertorum GB2-A4 TaxID=2933944 RepID=A0ABV0J210_9CYAN|nr:hypothetical protein [Trichocoleus sp. FACHB-46]MBD1860426.1 hypothetical protein [Trichocoleus sp. FACHB-46]